MADEKAPVLAGLAAGVALIVLFSFIFTSRIPLHLISDIEMQERMERTSEVQALYSRYPELSVGFHRDDKTGEVSFFGYTSVFPNGQGYFPQISYSMQLTSITDLLTGQVQETFLVCSISDGVHDSIQTIHYQDIHQEIITGDCLDVPIPDSWYVQPEPYTYKVSIGNRTFDVDYLFSSGKGSIRSMSVNTGTITISVLLTVDTNEATFFSVRLPGSMLEQLQTESELNSDLHYCVGNDFVVFVGDAPVDGDFTKDGTDEIITLQVPAGNSSLEIIGTDLLYSPPVCH